MKFNAITLAVAMNITGCMHSGELSIDKTRPLDFSEFNGGWVIAVPFKLQTYT
ncbi:MAG: hypothetical protein LJE83_13160 [Gammaproteobacteria bacterium]|jgi:hypothetical protein|nr:hypothetical protein [Gammaproteobacteria bacterium]